MEPITREDSPPTGDRRKALLHWLALLWSALITATGVWWLIEPEAYAAPAGPEAAARGSLVALLDPAFASAVLVGFGTLGALIAVTQIGRRSPEPARWVIVPGLSYAVIFGFLLPDLGLLVGAAYAAALLGVPAAVVGVGLLAVQYRIFRWITIGILLTASAMAVVFGVDRAAVVRSVGDIVSQLPEFISGQLPLLVAFLGGVLWFALALDSAGVRLENTQPENSAPTTCRHPKRDWGWWITVAAAACPLLFALQRMTWLTPWPIALEAHDLEAGPGLRIFGLLLAIAAIGGAWLTIGLILRWGAIYPRWIPQVGSGIVSPVWPTILAFVMGIAVAVGGRSLGQSMLMTRADDPHPLVASLAVLFIVWGPLLMIAAVAYYRRRTLSG